MGSVLTGPRSGTDALIPEVVLSILLESFRFMPSGKDIVWNRGNVTFPTVGRDADKATLPLKVRRNP